jgi:DNA-directed RNA polymerase subunit omega
VARITVEDCLEKVPNRFKLVHMVAARVRQIREGSEYLVSSPKNEDIVVALGRLPPARLWLKATPRNNHANRKCPPCPGTVTHTKTLNSLVGKAIHRYDMIEER